MDLSGRKYGDIVVVKHGGIGHHGTGKQTEDRWCIFCARCGQQGVAFQNQIIRGETHCFACSPKNHLITGGYDGLANEIVYQASKDYRNVRIAVRMGDMDDTDPKYKTALKDMKSRWIQFLAGNVDMQVVIERINREVDENMRYTMVDVTELAELPLHSYTRWYKNNGLKKRLFG